MQTPADRVIELFGGLSALAQALGHRHVTTVQGWRVRGVIPIRQQAAVIAAARDRGIELEPSIFIPAQRVA